MVIGFGAKNGLVIVNGKYLPLFTPSHLLSFSYVIFFSRFAGDGKLAAKAKEGFLKANMKRLARADIVQQSSRFLLLSLPFPSLPSSLSPYFPPSRPL